MNVRVTVFALGTALMPALSSCSSSEASSLLCTCAQCGVIRSIDSRTAWGDPPAESAVSGAIIEHPIVPPGMFRRAETHTIYTVRIRMDRGGARDLMVGARGELHVGDRVEIRDGRVVQL
jgi:hypothetical protein